LSDLAIVVVIVVLAHCTVAIIVDFVSCCAIAIIVGFVARRAVAINVVVIVARHNRHRRRILIVNFVACRPSRRCHRHHSRRRFL